MNANIKEIEEFTKYRIVNGVWNMDSLPNHYIVELTDGTLSKFFMNPFRMLSNDDFTVYKGYHPRKCKGYPMPEYLYRFYGLQRNDEVLSETVRLRLSPSEKEKLEAYCYNMEPKKSVSELLRDYVRSLI